MRFALAAGAKVAAFYPSSKNPARAIFVTVEDAREILRQLDKANDDAHRDGTGNTLIGLLAWDEGDIRGKILLPLVDALDLREQMRRELPKARKQRASKIERAAEKARPFIRSLRPGAPDVGDDVPLPIRITERAKLARKLGGAR